MICVICIVCFDRLRLCILHRCITTWVLTGDLGNLSVYLSCFFCVALLWVKFKNGHHLCIAIIGGKRPCYLYDGTVYLDTKEILRATSNRDSSLESDYTIYIRHGGSTDESVSLPGSASIPCEIISGLIILHDGWYSVIVIRLGRLTFNRFLFGLIVLCQKTLPITLF